MLENMKRISFLRGNTNAYHLENCEIDSRSHTTL